MILIYFPSYYTIYGLFTVYLHILSFHFFVLSVKPTVFLLMGGYVCPYLTYVWLKKSFEHLPLYLYLTTVSVLQLKSFSSSIWQPPASLSASSTRYNFNQCENRKSNLYGIWLTRNSGERTRCGNTQQSEHSAYCYDSASQCKNIQLTVISHTYTTNSNIRYVYN